MKFKTAYNAHEFPCDGEVNDMPSETVPDQSMSMGEILRRYASGLPLKGVRVPLYEGEDDADLDLPDLSRMDHADRAMHMKDMADTIKEAKDRFTAYQDAQNRRKKIKEAKQPPKEEKPKEGAPKTSETK